MDEIAALTQQLTNMNDNWFELMQNTYNTVVLLENVTENILSNIQQLVALASGMSSSTANPNPVSNNIGTTINPIVPTDQPKQGDTKESEIGKAVNSTVEKLSESAIKAIVRKGNKTFYEVFSQEFKTGMKDVAADVAGDAATSVISGLGVDEAIAGGLGAILEGVGVVLALEFVLPAIAIGYLGKKLFFDKPSNSPDKISKQPVSRQSSAELAKTVNDMVATGAIEFREGYSYDGKTIKKTRSTVEDFIKGKPTDIDFRSRFIYELFKKQYDPKNQEFGWHYNPSMIDKPIPQKSVSYLDQYESDVLHGLEETYYKLGDRAEGYMAPIIDRMKKTIGNGPLKPRLDRMLTQYYNYTKAVKAKENGDSKDARSQYYLTNPVSTGQSTKAITVNINKSIVENLIINENGPKEKFDNTKQKIEQLFLEVLNGFQYHI